MRYRFLIIGAGLSGSVLARELISKLDCSVDIWEERDHVAGNCYTYEDAETGITVHKYGPHIFNTDKKEIWNYFDKFSPLRPYVHHVKASHNGRLYTMPLNLNTLTQFFGRTFTPEEAKEYLEQLRDHTIIHPANFEELAIQTLGRELYHAFFYGYTKKQWGCEPRELPASILKRIPVRFDHNNNYHLHSHTGIPENGYTDFVNKLIVHPDITISLKRKFEFDESILSVFDHIFYTGSIDAFFNYREGMLSYRTLRFEKETHDQNFQGCVQINYCDEAVPCIRVTEHKYFTPWKNFKKTVVFKEYSSEAGKNDILYYPKRLKKDLSTFNKYHHLATSLKGVSFLGRLGTYRYLDMQHVIEEAITFAKKIENSLMDGKKIPAFLKV